MRTGDVKSHAYILLTGDRVLSISDKAPGGVPVTDLSAYTVLPGLIDAHGHILSDPTSQSAATELRETYAQATLWGVYNLRLWLDHGFTAVRDACEGPTDYPQFALRDSVTRGMIQGPRISAAGSCISLTGGHGDGFPFSPDLGLPRGANIADTPDEIARVVRRDIKYGADWIKLMATGGVMDPISDYHVEELSEAQMAMAVEVAHRAGKKVMAHAEGTTGIKAAVRAGVDSIEHGTMLDEEGAKLMEEHGTWLVPTLYCFQHDMETGLSKGREPESFAKGQEILAAQGPAFKLALAHHLKIAYGVDDSDVDESVSREFGALVAGGMTTLGALQAATINAATLLGKDKEFGSIEPGHYADIIAVSGDPLADIKVMYDVKFVMKGGKIIKDPAHPDRNVVARIH
ncbi:metal-dependent hydrolase family protein [Acidicapsa ligni]|uniref:metal-dependent hydrolase family protein n=1 Tax=Acidicapsa ligni TaxID=542300 RepID=UPI0021E05350|nr:amidohydrolase family protein [Acidicapsa ligni]